MTENNIEQMDGENTFSYSFARTSFEGRIASWVVIFTYAFMAITLFSIVLEKLYPFSVTPPDFFMQFLFLLLMTGILEVISIQFGNVKDTCIIDYAKGLITLIEQRFMFHKISVISSFEQIKSIGVSARATSLHQVFFSQHPDRFAIVAVNFRNQFLHITDYNMNLEEANTFCQQLCTRHMPHAQFIAGEADTQLILDILTDEMVPAPCRRSWSSLVDAATMPVFQTFSALLITLIIITATMTLLAQGSRLVFNTDLLLSYQPVLQIFSTPEPRKIENKDILTPPEGPPPQELPLVTVSQVDIIVDESESLAQTSTATLIVASESIQTQSSETADLSSSTTMVAVQTTAAIIASESAAQPESHATESADTAKMVAIATPTAPATSASASLTPEEEFKKIFDNAEVLPKKAADIKPITTKSPENNNPKSPQIHQPVFMPLTAKVPTVSIDTIFLRKKSSKPTKNITAKISPKAPDATPLRAVTAKNTATGTPAISAKTVILPKSTASLKPMPTPVKKPIVPAKPQKQVPVCDILPGYGINPLASLGDSMQKTIDKLGQPVATFKNAAGRQVVYSGFALTSSNNDGDKITEIIVTKSVSSAGPLKTPQNLMIGSSIDETRKRLGPPVTIVGSPGLHFPTLGVTFVPSPAKPEIIGAIKLYKATEKLTTQ